MHFYSRSGGTEIDDALASQTSPVKGGEHRLRKFKKTEALHVQDLSQLPSFLKDVMKSVDFPHSEAIILPTSCQITIRRVERTRFHFPSTQSSLDN